MAALQLANYPTKFKDLEKQRIPDYVSMEMFRDEIDASVDDPFLSSTDLISGTELAEEKSIKNLDETGISKKIKDNSSFTTSYLTNIETDLTDLEEENFSAKAKRPKRIKRLLEGIPLLDLNGAGDALIDSESSSDIITAGGDQKSASCQKCNLNSCKSPCTSPYKTNVCQKCGRKRFICTCKKHTVHQKFTINTPHLELDEYPCREYSCHEQSSSSNLFDVKYSVTDEKSMEKATINKSSESTSITELHGKQSNLDLNQDKSSCSCSSESSRKADATATTATTSSERIVSESSIESDIRIKYERKVKGYYKAVNKIPSSPQAKTDNFFKKFFRLFRQVQIILFCH